MKIQPQPLFDIQSIDGYQSHSKFPFKCNMCNEIFYVIKKFVKNAIRTGKHKFCSRKCMSAFMTKKVFITVSCANCNEKFSKYNCEIKRSNNNFCSRSCAATYNNTHKTNGIRRSKLERWLEVELTKLLPNIDFVFNGKETINSELDIYIESLKLAFELNGIFHYEPIYGTDKLISIHNNDNRKFQACLEKQISLVIIDTSKQNYFKPQTAKKYLDIILSIIENHKQYQAL